MNRPDASGQIEDEDQMAPTQIEVMERIQIGGRIHDLAQPEERGEVFCFRCLPESDWPKVAKPIFNHEIDGVISCCSCGIRLLDYQVSGEEPSGTWWEEVEAAVRDQAVARVDGREGCTMEFAGTDTDIAVHGEEYDEEERRLWEQLALLAFTRAHPGREQSSL